MSRAYCFLAAALLAMTFVGCGGDDGNDASSEVSSNDSGASDLDGTMDDSGSDIDADDGSGDDANYTPDYSADSGSDLDSVDSGSDLDSVGSGDDDNYKPDYSADSGSDLDNVGSGSDLDNVGSGSDLDNVGSGNDDDYKPDYSAQGSDLDNVGSGSDLDNVGSGSDLDNVGSGSDLDNVGSGNDDNYTPDYSADSGSDIDGSGPSRRKPKTYADQARVAFQQGHDNMAIKYSYAAILVEPEAAKRQRLHFWAGPKKPMMALRWGVGINYVAPKTLTSRPPMIGEKPKNADRKTGSTRRVFGRRNQDNGDGSGDYDTGDAGYDSGEGGGEEFRLPKDSWGQLLYLTGEVGDRFIERLDMRRVRGYYGALLKDAPKSPRRSRGGSEDGGYTDDSSDGGYVDPSGGDSYDDGVESAGSTGSAGPQLIPGVTMLGMGSSKELLGRAQQQDIDVLIVFDVTYTQSVRSNIEKNEIVMRLYSVAEGKELRKSAPINNLSVWSERETLKDKSKDPVDLAIDSVLRIFADEHVRLVDLPELDSEKARFRVKSLTASKAADPLPVLAEIKYFHTKGWLSDSELADAYKQLLGDAGLQLVSEEPEVRKTAIATLLGNTELEAVPLDDGGFNTGGFR